MNSSSLGKEAIELIPYCETKTQERTLQALIDNGNATAAAKVLGITRSTVQNCVRAVRRHKAKAGQSHHVPNGHNLVGVSTLTKTDEGEPQWIKTKADAKEQEFLLKEMVQTFTDSIKPLKRAKKPKGKRPADLMNVHVLTDYHLGMRAWGSPDGDCPDSWDIKIAEKLLYDWFAHAIETAPDAHTGVLAQMGDFLHWDGMDAVTPASGHLLDADGRFQKVVRVAIRCIRRIIDEMLQKYDKVHIIMADANHDPASSAWLREMTAALYDKEPRITVDNSADTYYVICHGDTSVFFHHGHKRKPTNIDTVLTAKFREVFGNTKHSYCHMGHMHHQHLIETNLMIVEQHRTMAAADAFASRGGWMSGRGAPVITYSDKYGEVARQMTTPDMFTR